MAREVRLWSPAPSMYSRRVSLVTLDQNASCVSGTSAGLRTQTRVATRPYRTSPQVAIALPRRVFLMVSSIRGFVAAEC